VEGKQLDGVKMINHTSVIMMSNTEHEIFIESDDRRFSCVDMGDKTLLNFCEENGYDISEFNQYLKDYCSTLDYQNAFINFIEENQYEEFDPGVPFKGETFYHLVRANLTEYQACIVDTIEAGVRGNFTLDEIGFDWGQFTRKPKASTLDNFLRNYRIDGKPLGYLLKSKSTEGHTVMVNPELKKEKLSKLEEECLNLKALPNDNV
jgi:hypothetical protein